LKQAGLGVGGYNVHIDGNFGDEDYYQLRSASSGAFGGERDFAIGASKFDQSNVQGTGLAVSRICRGGRAEAV